MQRALVWAYRLFPVVLLPLMIVLSRDFGVTWDEKTHQLYGERVFRFLTERLDDDWFRPGGEIFMYLVGGLFDTPCVAVQQVLPGDVWVTRHYVNAVFGWLGICTSAAWDGSCPDRARASWPWSFSPCRRATSPTR